MWRPLLLLLALSLAACAPAATSKPTVNYQSFIATRGFKTIQAETAPFSDEVLINASSGHEWIIKLAKPGKRLLIGVLSKNGAVDFLVNNDKLEDNTPLFSDTSSNDAKQYDLKNPAPGTYYVYALNRTKSPQRYTLIVALE